MNLAAVTDFAKSMATSLNELYGSTVTVSGTAYTGVVSTGTPELNLDSGGFQKPVDFIVRIRKADMANAPSVKAAVIINGTTYRLLSVRQAFTALAQEWILEVGTP